MRYFNMKKPVTIQVNASGKGLGAALIQDDGPVTFTSKSPSHPKHSHPWSSALQTMKGNYFPVSSMQHVSRHMFLVDTS